MMSNIISTNSICCQRQYTNAAVTHSYQHSTSSLLKTHTLKPFESLEAIPFAFERNKTNTPLLDALSAIFLSFRIDRKRLKLLEDFDLRDWF